MSLGKHDIRYLYTYLRNLYKSIANICHFTYMHISSLLHMYLVTQPPRVLYIARPLDNS